VYELGPRDRKTVKIDKATKIDDSIRIEAVTTGVAPDVRSAPQVYREGFRLDLKRNVLFHEPPLMTSCRMRSAHESIFLKVPLIRGTRWPFSAAVASLIEAPAGAPSSPPEAVKRTGVCEIRGIGNQTVLSRTETCLEVGCTIHQKNQTFVHTMYHCKNLGYVGTKISGRTSEQEIQPWWLEQLVEIR